MDIKVIKKGIVILYIVILVYSGFMDFYAFPELDLALTTFHIKGFYIVLVSGLFYVYSFFTNKKSLGLIALAVSIIGYIITIIAMSRAEIGLSDCSIGAYLYFGSFILFIGSLLVPTEDSLVNEISKISKEENTNVEQLNINGSYFVCSYITGIKKAQNIYKCISISY